MLEVAGLAEVLIDRGEADIGDRVEPLQAFHHQLADPGRGHLAVAAGLELALDRRGELLDPLRGGRPLAAGDRDRPLELGPVERLAPILRFDDEQLARLDPLEGGEALAAFLALSPAPDGGAVLGGTAVLHLAVFVGAIGAAQKGVPTGPNRWGSARTARERASSPPPRHRNWPRGRSP